MNGLEIGRTGIHCKNTESWVRKLTKSISLLSITIYKRVIL